MPSKLLPLTAAALALTVIASAAPPPAPPAPTPTNGDASPAFVAGGVVFFTWQEPLGKAADDPRIIRIIRKLCAREPADLANVVCNEIVNRELQPGQIAILLQHYGMGGGDPSDDPDRGPALFQHWDDSVDPEDAEQWWMTTWMSHGIEECRAYMETFIAQYKARQAENPDIPDPDRFHFDSESKVVPHATNFQIVEAFDAMTNDPRWATERIPGNGGKTLATLYAEGGSPIYDPTRSWGQSPNEDWALWYAPICFQAMDGAMDEAAYSLIREAWPTCKSSNYTTSGGFDGEGDPPRLRFPVEMDWYTFPFQHYGDLRAPVVYWIHPNQLLPGETINEGAVRRTGVVIDYSVNSFEGHPTNVVPWIQLYGNSTVHDEGLRVVTREHMFAVLAILNDNGVNETLVWSNGSTQVSNEYWNAFDKFIDAIWGTCHTDVTVEIGVIKTPDDRLMGAKDELPYVVKGDPVSGGTRKTKTRVGFELDVEEDGPPAEIKVSLRSWITRPSGSGKLKLVNWQTGNDDTIESFTVTKDPSKQNVTVDSGPYVREDGRVEVVVIHQANDGFRSKIDLVKVKPVAEE